MNLDFDESIKVKQQEWSSLLQLEELNIKELPACPLTNEERLFLATLWLHDGTKGGNIDFPQTTFQLRSYEFTRSHFSLVIFSMVFFIHTCLPFFEQPYCAWTSHGTHDYDYNQHKSDNYLSPHTASILELFCLVFYLFEIFLRLSINIGGRKNRGLDFYTRFRLIIVIFLILDSIWSIINYRPERLIRATLPIVYITRRKSLRQMSWGLMVVAYKCLPVFGLLVCIILAWSYLGRMIFGNLNLDGNDHFGSLLSAFLTTLESYSCRGFVPFTLDPLFRINPSSAIFFVSLTIFADIFCQALIVATGTRQYQLYSVTIFKKELMNRKRAMLAVFGILKQYTQELAMQAAMNKQSEILSQVVTDAVPDAIPKNETLNPLSENVSSTPVNSTPTNSRPSSTRSIFDPNSVIQRTAKNFWKERSLSEESLQRDSANSFPQQSYAYRESLYNPKVDNSDLRISKQAWMDFCSHLQGKYQISPELAEMLFDKEIELEESGVLEATNRQSWTRDSFHNKRKSQTINEGLSVVGLFRLAALLDGEINVEGDLDSDEDVDENQETNLPENESSKPKTPVTRRRSGSDHLHVRTLSRRKSQSMDQGSGVGIMLATNLLDPNESSSAKGIFPKKSSQPLNIKSVARWIKKKSVIFARYVAEAYIIFDFVVPLFNHRYLTKHIIFDIFVALTRILLAVQLVYMTIPSSPTYWYDIGWGLQAFFWFEMYIRVASSYIPRRRSNGRLLIINTITTSILFTMKKTRTREDEISGPMIAYICFQWLRLVRVALPFRISAVIKSLLSLIVRVVFLIFAVIYFFSTIGYYRFCNAFDVEEAEDVDDWASKWTTYYKQLNFNTMLQTVYTLFEVAVLGSWSYVMRAAMLSGFLSALFFFYAYRLIMTLVVIPILTSFIIQAYNARSIKLLQEEQMSIQKHIREKEQEKELTFLQQMRKDQEDNLMNAIPEEDLRDGSFQVSRGNQSEGKNEEKNERGDSLISNDTFIRSTEGTLISRGSFSPSFFVDCIVGQSMSTLPKLERKLTITRASNAEHSMISFWSSTGNESASAVVNTNKSPPPTPSTSRPSTLNRLSVPNRISTSISRESNISSISSSSKPNKESNQPTDQSIDQIQTLNDLVKELSRALQEKNEECDRLKEDSGRVFEENSLLKSQLEQITQTYDGSDDADALSVFED